MPPVTTIETETVFYHDKEVSIEQAIDLCSFLGAIATQQGLEAATNMARSLSEAPTSEQDTDLQLTDDEIYSRLMGLDENTDEPNRDTKDTQTPVGVEQDYQPWSIYQWSDGDRRQHEQLTEPAQYANDHPESFNRQDTITEAKPTESLAKNTTNEATAKKKIIETKQAEIVLDVEEETIDIVEKKPTEIVKPKTARRNISSDGLDVVDAIEPTAPEIQNFEPKPKPIFIEKNIETPPPIARLEQDTAVTKIIQTHSPTTEVSFAEQSAKAAPAVVTELPIDLQTDFVGIFDRTTSSQDKIEPKNSFEQLVLDTTQDDEVPLSLEIIQEQANEQTVEKTLTQLVHLIESKEMTKDVELELVLQQVIVCREIIEKDLKRAIDQKKVELDEITPKMIDQIIELLRLLGYKDPKYALDNFGRRCDMEMLVQALEYIVQCQSKNKPHETLKKTGVFFKAQSNGPLIAQIGKHVVQLLRGNSWNLQLLPVKE